MLIITTYFIVSSIYLSGKDFLRSFAIPLCVLFLNLMKVLHYQDYDSWLLSSERGDSFIHTPNQRNNNKGTVLMIS